MKRKIAGMLAAFTAAALLMTACSSDEKDESSAPASSVSEEKKAETTEYTPPEEVSVTADPDAVPLSGAAPVLSITSAEGAPGEVVSVTVSVSGADKKWAMCGVHVTYDERLFCLEDETQENIPIFEKGEAVLNAEAFVSMLQIGDNRNDYLIENKQNAVFFAAVAGTDACGDGDIITYQFQIPEDAESGEVYELGFYYRDGDMFLDIAKDPALQDYAFSHWQGAAVTVK